MLNVSQSPSHRFPQSCPAPLDLPQASVTASLSDRSETINSLNKFERLPLDPAHDKGIDAIASLLEMFVDKGDCVRFTPRIRLSKLFGSFLFAFFKMRSMS